MMTGAIGRRLLRLAAVLAVTGLTVGCASSQGPTSVTAPAGYGKDANSRAERLVQYCDRLAEKGEMVTALGLCARAHEIDPDDPVPLMKVAALLKTMNRHQAAAETYAALLERHPGHQEARYSLGKLYMESGDTARASVQFNYAMRNAPDDPRAYNALGIIRDQEGEHEAAQGLYRLALERDPKSVSVRNNLGLSLALNGRRDEAIDVLAELAVDPTASQTVLRNLEAAYAVRTVPPQNETPVAAPAAVPAAATPGPTPVKAPHKAPEKSPVKATSVPAEPVQSEPMSEPAVTPKPLKMPARAPVVKGPKARDQAPESGKPTPLFPPPAASHTSEIQPSESSRRDSSDQPAGPSSVILAAAERLMQPPEWADFEPGALIDAAPAEPAEMPQNGGLGEITVDTMDLSFLQDDADSRPFANPQGAYSLSLLMLNHEPHNA